MSCSIGINGGNGTPCLRHVSNKSKYSFACLTHKRRADSRMRLLRSSAIGRAPLHRRLYRHGWQPNAWTASYAWITCNLNASKSTRTQKATTMPKGITKSRLSLHVGKIGQELYSGGSGCNIPCWCWGSFIRRPRSSCSSTRFDRSVSSLPSSAQAVFSQIQLQQKTSKESKRAPEEVEGIQLADRGQLFVRTDFIKLFNSIVDHPHRRKLIQQESVSSMQLQLHSQTRSVLCTLGSQSTREQSCLDKSGTISCRTAGRQNLSGT